MCPPPHPPGASAPIYPGVEPATLFAMAIPAASSIPTLTSAGASRPRPASSGSMAGDANTQTLALYAFIHTAAGCRRAGARGYVCSVMHDGRCLCRATGAARWISSRCRGRLSCASWCDAAMCLCRIGKGGRYSPSTLPEEPLVLWAYEPSPFCRVVRERLVELEIPHFFKSVSRGSPKRQQMFDKYGKFQAPLLEVRPPPPPCLSIRMLSGTPARKYTFFATS